MSAIEGIAKNSELRRRILFTLFMLVIYRVGVHVPTPGVDSGAVLQFFQNQGGIFGLFNTFTGGALNQFSVFALGIMPYISSSIIFELLTSVVPYLEAKKKEGEPGRRQIQKYTRYGTVILAVIQGFAISNWLANSNYQGTPLVLGPSVGFVPFQLMTIVTLTAGTCFIMWLGEQISERGLGEGASLIIFAGIAAGIPQGAAQLFQLVTNNEMSGIIALALLVMMVVVVGTIIYLEVGQRRITIHSAQRGARMMGAGAQGGYLPLKINMAGVIPPIFASSLLLFPATIAQFADIPWITAIQDSLNPNGAIYNVLFVALIVFFCFFYTEIKYDPNEMSDNLKKGGKFIPGIRAGNSTAEYIKRVLDRLTVGGAIYLSIICVIPGILIQTMKVPFYFGGTSLLILVGVALNTTQQIQAYLLTQKYEGFMKGAKLRSRRVQY